MRKPLSCLVLALALATLAAGGREDEKLKIIPLPVNTAADEDEPHLADNGLTLYWGVTVKGQELVKVAKRRAAGGAWGKPDDIVEYVTNKGDVRGVYSTPGTKKDPQYLFFAAKDKKGKNYDLFAAVKQFDGAEWTAPTPVQADGVNTAMDEAYPWLTNDGKTLYFSRKTKEGWKVLTATRTKITGPAGWGEPTELDLPAGFHHACVTPDGKTMFLQGPLDKGRWGLFTAASAGKGAWDKPEPLAGLNDEDAKVGDRSPNLSREGRFLYFASDRAGGKGGFDLYAVDVAKLLPKKK